MTLANATTDEKPIRFRLRAATAPLHELVDAHMGGLLRQTVGGYERFLTASARALLPLERALVEAGVVEILPDWPERARSDALRADLAALSLSGPDTHAVYEDPHLKDEAYMLGAVYVLEGSRLGASVLVRMFESAPAHALHYLSHGNELPLWQTFLARLETSAAIRRNPEVTIAGASAAFKLFLPGNS